MEIVQRNRKAFKLWITEASGNTESSLPEAEESEIKSIFDEVQRAINDAPRLLLEPNKTQYFRVSEQKIRKALNSKVETQPE